MDFVGGRNRQWESRKKTETSRRERRSISGDVGSDHRNRELSKQYINGKTAPGRAFYLFFALAQYQFGDALSPEVRALAPAFNRHSPPGPRLFYD
jgi:hypothetical protein